MLLFLDFDGVLHASDDISLEYTACGIEHTGDNLFRYLPLLAEVLDRHPDVQVVVSSSWRQHYTLDELRAFFGRHGDRVVGTTLGSSQIAGNRYEECLHTAEALGADDWLLIDDHAGVVFGSWTPTPDQARRVVLCDPMLGLSTPCVIDRINEFLCHLTTNDEHPMTPSTRQRNLR